MAQRKYKTARGAVVDYGTMLTNNELTPALGNMNVNARGDEILSDGTITRTRDQIMKEYYNLNTQVPQDGAIPESSNSAHNVIQEDPYEDQDFDKAAEEAESAKDENAPVATGTNVGKMVSEKSEAQPSGSLASAVAGAKNVSTDSTVDKGDFAETEGVTRI